MLKLSCVKVASQLVVLHAVIDAYSYTVVAKCNICWMSDGSYAIERLSKLYNYSNGELATLYIICTD